MSADPRPLHMGWLLLLTPILCIAGIALAITPNTQGVWEGYPLTILSLSILPALGFIPANYLWCLFIWVLFVDSKAKKLRALLVLLPSLALLTLGAWSCIADPPSPQKFFARHFQAPLPAGAHDIKARSLSPADPGLYAFFFRCHRADTESLIQALGAEEIPFNRELDSFPPIRIPNAPDVTRWPECRYFLKTNPTAGYIVFTNTALDEVYVLSDPSRAEDDEALE